MDPGDPVTDYCIKVDQVITHASKEAFHPTKERDLFSLGIPHVKLFRGIDPSYKGLIFLDSDLEIKGN